MWSNSGADTKTSDQEMEYITSTRPKRYSSHRTALVFFINILVSNRIRTRPNGPAVFYAALRGLHPAIPLHTTLKKSCLRRKFHRSMPCTPFSAQGFGIRKSYWNDMLQSPPLTDLHVVWTWMNINITPSAALTKHHHDSSFSSHSLYTPNHYRRSPVLPH